MTLRDILNPWGALREAREDARRYYRLWQDVCEANGALRRDRAALRLERASLRAELDSIKRAPKRDAKGRFVG